MTDDPLYPCGVDCLGVAVKPDRQDRKRFGDGRPYHTDMRVDVQPTGEALEGESLTKLMPWLVDAVVLLPAGAGCKFIIRPDRAFRVDTVHAVGPCELLSVDYLGQQFLPHEGQFGARRWVFVSHIIQPGQDLVCQLFCTPGLFMLHAGEQGPPSVLVTSGRAHG